MFQERDCGCKGCRSCLICEKNYDLDHNNQSQLYKKFRSFVYCPDCDQLYEGWNVKDTIENHGKHKTPGKLLPGIMVKKEFLSAKEASDLVKNVDGIAWDKSQSGRRKQNFGPKANFKKKKLQLGDFNGFPEFTKFIQTKFESISLLKNYQTIEQCSLEYTSLRGASIDPHIDDCWIWGERVVTVNCLGDSVLSLTPYYGPTSKYNLDLIQQYSNNLISPLLSLNRLNEYRETIIRIPMPSLSIIVLYGPARYQFEHSVLREDTPERRVCIAYREFTSFYNTDGAESAIGSIIVNKAKEFW